MVRTSQFSLLNLPNGNIYFEEEFASNILSCEQVHAVVRTLPSPSRGCCAAVGWWALGSTPPPSGTSLA